MNYGHVYDIAILKDMIIKYVKETNVDMYRDIVEDFVIINIVIQKIMFSIAYSFCLYYSWSMQFSQEVTFSAISYILGVSITFLERSLESMTLVYIDRLYDADNKTADSLFTSGRFYHSIPQRPEM